MAVTDYSITPGSNTSISGIDISEGCSPGNLNDALRQMMADTRGFWNVSVRTTGNFTVAGTITFSAAPVFSNQSGTRTALGLGTAAVEDADAFQAALTNVTASRLLGRGAGTAGALQELTLSTGLAFSGTAIQVNTADQSTWNTGTSTTESAISPEKLAATIDHQRPEVVAIAEQTLAGSTTFTFAHGLSAIPRNFEAFIRCASDSNGFVADQVIKVALWQDSTTQGATMWADDTNVYVRIEGYATFGPTGYVTLTYSNFRIFVRVWP